MGNGGTVGTLDFSLRPLRSAERRLLRAKIRQAKTHVRRGPKMLLPGAVVIVVLWALTLLVSATPWPVVTAFWIVVGGAILLWVRRDLRRDLGQASQQARRYESALRRNAAREYRVDASGFVEFAEVEDEGACYAFAIDGNRLVFVSGQEFYPQAKFPSHDFSLVYVLDERDSPVATLVEKRGPRAAPARTIPAAAKLELEIPDQLQVIAGGVDRVEDLLRPNVAFRGAPR